MLLVMMTICSHVLFAQMPPAESGTELLSDPVFAQGFNLTAATNSAPKLELGTLQVTAESAQKPPAWRIAQWASTYLLEPGVFTKTGEDTWKAETPGKQVVISRSSEDVIQLLLEAYGIREYGGHLRQNGEPWPHLLIEQGFATPIKLTNFASLKFNLSMRITKCIADPAFTGKLDPGLHTAQTSIYWTVHNLTAGNPDERDMIWFGIPLFDARYDVPPPNYALDGGKADASGKFICLLDGKRFWTGKTGDGQWRSLEVELMELIREGLTITQEHGYLKNTKPEDLCITSINLGWELAGPYDAGLEIRGLSMKGKKK